MNRKQTICYGKTKFFLSQFFIAKWYLYTEIKTLRTITRSSHPMGSVEKGVLKNFVNFTGKHLAGVNFIKKETPTPTYSIKSAASIHLDWTKKMKFPIKDFFSQIHSIAVLVCK